MEKTTLTGMDKPSGDEPFARATLNGNADTIDKNMIMLFAFGCVPFAGYSKGAMVFDGNGMPQSQSIAGPNGLTGSIIYSFTETTATTTVSITAPESLSMTVTTNLNDFSEEGVPE